VNDDIGPGECGIAEVERGLDLELAAVLGASYGAMVALRFGALAPFLGL
jgi:pimeloyl-ACP methyl ester carboxylesterase